MSRARACCCAFTSLPNTASFVIVAATVAVPGYILGEVFLSFLGMAGGAGCVVGATCWRRAKRERGCAIIRGCSSRPVPPSRDRDDPSTSSATRDAL